MFNIKRLIKMFAKGKETMNDIAAESSLLYELSGEEKIALKNCLLEMFRDVNRVCEKYGLKLILTGGSALGAVRHKGFIPWDDDLDLCMERKDYNRFVETFETELGEKYILNAPNYKTSAKTRFAKIFKKGTTMMEIYDINDKYPTNIFLDLFPIESAPNNVFLQKIKGFFCNILMFIGSQVSMFENRSDILKKYMCSSLEGKVNYYLRCIIGFVFSILPSKLWFNIIDRCVSSCKNTDYCAIPTGRKHYFGELLEREVYFPCTKGEFEGLSVNLPHNLDRVLTNLYGDYMRIPPLEKRERHFVIDFNLYNEHTMYNLR